jgi:hypothetical protein
LQVVRAWKGVQNEQLEVSTPMESAACGYDFAQDESYFVYASERDGHLNVNSCSRTRKMSDADEDVRTLGMGATPVDPRATPSPAAPTQAQPPAHAGCASCSLEARETTAPYPALCLFAAALVARRARATFRRRSGSRS